MKNKTDNVRIEFVILMALMTSIMALSIDTILPALETIGLDLKISSPSHAQFIISVLFIGFGLGQLLFGPLSDTFGRKKPIYLGGIIFIAGCIISYFSTTLEIMLLGRLLQGFGAASFRTISIALIRDEYSGIAMAKTISLVMTVFILVPVLAPSLGQLILFISPWRSIFLLFLFLCLLTLVWFAIRQEETLKIENRKRFSIRNIYNGAKETCSTPSSLSATLMSGLVFGGFIAYLSSSQQIFQHIYGVGTQFPLYFGSLALTIGISSFVNSHLVHKFGVVNLVRFSLTVMTSLSLCFVLYLFFGNIAVPPLPLLMFFFASFFCCVGLLFGNLNTLALSELGHIAGIASSVVGSIQNFVSVFIGVLIASQFTNSLLPIIAGFSGLSLSSLIIIKYGMKKGHFKEF